MLGILPPGPINNTNLFEKSTKTYNEKTLKKALNKVR